MNISFKSRNRYKLRWQLLSIILIFTVIPILIFSFVYYQITFKNLLHQNKDFYTGIMTQVRNQVDKEFSSYLVTLNDIMETSNFQMIIKRPDFNTVEEERRFNDRIGENGDRPEGESIRRMVMNRMDASVNLIEFNKKSLIHKTFYNIYPFSGEAFVINIPGLIHSPLYKMLKQNREKYISGVLSRDILQGFETDHRPVILYPPEETDENTGSSLFLAVLNRSFLRNTFSSITRLDYGTLFIADRFNNLIEANHPGSNDFYDYDPSIRQYLKPEMELAARDEMNFIDYQYLITDPQILQNTQVRQMLKNIQLNQSDYEISDVWHQNKKYLLIGTVAPVSQYRLLFFLPYRILNKPLLTVIGVVIYTALILLILVTVFSVYFSRILINPVEKMIQIINRNISGEYQKVEIRSGNELELLGKFFNQMMDQIRVNQNDLENIIEQRTKEYILAKREAEEANLQKSKFLANVSHEIRTQMNSLLGILNLIDMGTFDLSFEVEKRLSELKNILRIKAMQKTDDSDSQMILERIESLFKVIDNDKSVKKIFYGHLEEDVLSICTDPSESETVSNIFAEIQSAIDKENTDYHQSIRRARDSGNYLLSIVNRILNLAKVESGRVDIHPEEIDFNSFFSDLQFTIANYVTSKEKNGKIEIIYDIQLNHYKTIISDKNIIKEVLLNLVSNSVKYTEKGSVIIRVVSDAQSLRFYIIDTGIGIKDEDKKSIFTAYSRGFNVVNVEGTGLGLILSKYLIESIGGSIGFDSQYLLGSTFWFSIPIN